MTLEDVIDSLNEHIYTKRILNIVDVPEHIVLIKQTQTHPTLKLYKEYKCTLWYVNKATRYKILTYQRMERVPSDKEEDFKKSVEVSFIKLIFDWIGTNSYNEVVNGTYTGNKDEQIPDSDN